jgi:hypothetical protein
MKMKDSPSTVPKVKHKVAEKPHVGVIHVDYGGKRGRGV